MKNTTMQTTQQHPGKWVLYDYLFSEENFILGGKILFKGITHLAQYGVRLKKISVNHPQYKKFLHAEFNRISQGIGYQPFCRAKAILAFREYLWRIVCARSTDICPYGGVCNNCPLAPSCRRTFDDRFDATYSIN